MNATKTLSRRDRDIAVALKSHRDLDPASHMAHFNRKEPVFVPWARSGHCRPPGMSDHLGPDLAATM